MEKQTKNAEKERNLLFQLCKFILFLLLLRNGLLDFHFSDSILTRQSHSDRVEVQSVLKRSRNNKQTIRLFLLQDLQQPSACTLLPLIYFFLSPSSLMFLGNWKCHWPKQMCCLMRQVNCAKPLRICSRSSILFLLLRESRSSRSVSVQNSSFFRMFASFSSVFLLRLLFTMTSFSIFADASIFQCEIAYFLL